VKKSNSSDISKDISVPEVTYTGANDMGIREHEHRLSGCGASEDRILASERRNWGNP
jgi:hypothetical protein